MIIVLRIHNQWSFVQSLLWRQIRWLFEWTEVSISKIIVSSKNWSSDWLFEIWGCLTSSSLLKIEWYFIPTSKGLFKSIFEFLSLCCVGSKSSISLNNISISPRSILIILNWLTMKVRSLLWSIFPEMLLTWKETTRMKLASWLLHFIKTSIVVVNISISTTTIWLIDDSSVTHHFDSVVVAWSWWWASKSSGWHVVASFWVRELLHTLYL